MADATKETGAADKGDTAETRCDPTVTNSQTSDNSTRTLSVPQNHGKAAAEPPNDDIDSHEHLNRSQNNNTEAGVEPAIPSSSAQTEKKETAAHVHDNDTATHDKNTQAARNPPPPKSEEPEDDPTEEPTEPSNGVGYEHVDNPENTIHQALEEQAPQWIRTYQLGKLYRMYHLIQISYVNRTSTKPHLDLDNFRQTIVDQHAPPWKHIWPLFYVYRIYYAGVLPVALTRHFWRNAWASWFNAKQENESATLEELEAQGEEETTGDDVDIERRPIRRVESSVQCLPWLLLMIVLTAVLCTQAIVILWVVLRVLLEIDWASLVPSQTLNNVTATGMIIPANATNLCQKLLISYSDASALTGIGGALSIAWNLISLNKTHSDPTLDAAFATSLKAYQASDITQAMQPQQNTHPLEDLAFRYEHQVDQGLRSAQYLSSNGGLEESLLSALAMPDTKNITTEALSSQAPLPCGSFCGEPSRYVSISEALRPPFFRNYIPTICGSLRPLKYRSHSQPMPCVQHSWFEIVKLMFRPGPWGGAPLGDPSASLVAEVETVDMRGCCRECLLEALGIVVRARRTATLGYEIEAGLPGTEWPNDMEETIVGME